MVCKEIRNNNKEYVKPPTPPLSPDWTIYNDPFFDIKENVYKVGVDVSFTGYKENVDPALESAKISGLKHILSFYNRLYDDRIFNQLLVSTETPDHHFPDRPNIKGCATFGLRVLVSIRAGLIDILTIKVNDVNRTTLELYMDSSTISDRFQQMAAKMEKYNEDLFGFKGRIGNVNFVVEAQQVRNFYTSLHLLFHNNGLTIPNNNQGLVIIGIGTDLRIKYVLYDDGQQLINLNKDFDKFLGSEGVNERTLFYIRNIDNILTAEVSVTDFLKRFTFDPPDINSLTSFNASPDQEVESLRKLLNGESEKTEEGKEQEDLKLFNPELKKTTFALTSGTNTFVGEPIFENPSGVLKDINTIDEAYANLLHKTGMGGLINAGVQCLLAQLPLDELRKYLALLLLLKLPCREFINFFFKTLGIRITDIPFIKTAVRREINECLKIAGLDKKIQYIKKLNAVAGTNIKTSADLENLDADVLLEVFEDEAQRILIKVCDIFKERIILDFDLLSYIQLPDIDFNFTLPDFTIPTITLPKLPTIDILAGMAQQIEQAVIDAIQTAIVETVKAIINDIVKNCFDFNKLNYGGAKLGNMLASTLDLEEGQELYKKAAGFVSGIISIPGDIRQTGESLVKFLDDVSLVLTPDELKVLLDGEPTDDTIKVMNCLVENKYQGLAPLVKNRSIISTTFKGLGDVIDKKPLLDEAASFTPAPTCEEMDNIKKRLLENKGLTPEQIDKELNAARKRKVDRLRELAGIIQAGPFKNIDMENCQLLAASQHPSVSILMDKTLNVLFDSTKSTFEQDISGFVSSIIEQPSSKQKERLVPRKVSITTPAGDSAEIQNPEYTRLLSQGVVVQDPTDLDGDPIITFEEKATDPQFGKTFVAPGLRENLRGIETDDRLFKVEEQTYKLVIPNILQNLGGTIRSQLPNISAVDPTYYEIDYMLVSSNKDSFEYFVRNRNNAQILETSVSLKKDNEISDPLKKVIRERGLSLYKTFSTQQSYFSHIMSKIWFGGGRILTKDGEKQVAYAKGVGRSSNATMINETLRELYASTVFDDIFRDMFGMVGSDISNSILFKTEIMSLINFIPNNDCELLGINSLKKDIKQEGAKDKCLNKNIGGKNRTDFEKKAISSALILILRLYIIEYFIRSIFLFTEFRIKDEKDVDDIILQTILINVVNDIKTFDEQYYNAFLTEAHNFYIDNVEFTEDPMVAVLYLIKQQIPNIVKKINTMVGFKKNTDLKEHFVNNILPTVEVDYAPDRLLKGINFGSFIDPNEDKNALNFDINNGNFVLERYVRVVEKENVSFPPALQYLQGFSNKVFSLKEFQNLIGLFRNEIMATLPDFTAGDQNVMYDDVSNYFEWSYGLRLMYYNKFDPQTNGRIQLLEDISRQGSNKRDNENTFNKALGAAEEISYQGGVVLFRTYGVPIISVEIDENFSNFQDLETSYKNNAKTLSELLLKTDEMSLFFDYCFPLKRVVAILINYCATYLGSKPTIKGLFNNTKFNMRSAFLALVNSGDYQYEDKTLGGNAGVMNNALNNIDTNGNNSGGVNTAGMAAKTPALILKGIVEMTDPNIGPARKIVDGAKAAGANVPIQLVSLALLPMNIFPPPPFGPGIGPPISPYGFVYLANDIDATFDSAQGKDIKKQEANEKYNLSLTSTDEECKDEDI